MMKSIAVFCGSSSGASPIYLDGARKLGKELAKRDITLVYGGSSTGLMGEIAKTVLEADGHVIGVMPTFLESKEILHHGLTQIIRVNTMHERKAKMAELADAFIAMPGGSGTLEELFEIFTWGQLGLHEKPIGLLNLNRYYDPLLKLFHHMVDEQFLHKKYLNMALVYDTPEVLLNQFTTYKAPGIKSFSKENK